MAEMALMALSIVACEAPSAVEADLSSDSASSRCGRFLLRLGRRGGVLGGGHFGVRLSPLGVVRPVKVDRGADKQQHHNDRNVSFGFFHSRPPVI